MTKPYRVVLVEDELAHAIAFAASIEMQGATASLCDAERVYERVSQLRPDVVILGCTQLALIPGIRREHPGLPVVVVSNDPSLEVCVRALRHGANEFLAEPVPASELTQHVERLGAQYRETVAAKSGRHTVLAIGAHPDDVEFGVGGILAAHADAGDPITILTVSKGRREGGVQLAWDEGAAAASVIGARLLFEDCLDTPGALLPVLRRVVASIEPTIVYVHSKHDRRQDHRTVHEATVAATEEVGTVACYQGNTGTVDFAPTRFIPIDSALERKLEMAACFGSRGDGEPYLDPDLITATARYWSQFGQGTYCEPLEIIRESVFNPVGPALVPDVWAVASSRASISV